MSRFERVLLYVGAPKTGTTSVQIMLWKNRSALIRQGFYIPLAGRAGTDQHIALPAIVLQADHREDLDRHANLRDVDKKTRRDDFLRELEEELRRAPSCHTLLMFSEHMFYSTATEIPLYRRLFAGYAAAFDSLMYLRRQDRWLASLDLQMRKAVAHADPRFNAVPPARYGRSVRAWEAVSDRCHIRRYDGGFLLRGDVIADFCATAGIDAGGLAALGIHANRSILQEQVELMDALNARLQPLPAPRRVLIRRGFLPLCTEVLGGTRIQLPRADAVATFQAYRDINRWLRITKDPGGPEYFFDEDFSDYEAHPRNDRRYSLGQLEDLLSAISARLEKRGRAAIDARGAVSRRDLIGAVVSAFVSLRRAELRHADESSPGGRGDG